MASKGPRSKLDHDSRARRQKVLEAPKEPPRPKAHWDHVLEEMVWLSKDFEAERKWKLAQAKRVAIRASKSCGDYANRGEKKVKEEEQHVRKVALNISKEVKKFWVKIEKLVLYKHQLELEEKKKKALDKQLDFLLGQTERYSTMLAENLVDTSNTAKPLQIESATKESNIPVEEEEDIQLTRKCKDLAQTDSMDIDNEFEIQPEDEAEDDEETIEEDEKYITEEERKEELAALQAECDLPLEELLKNYTKEDVSREVCSENIEEPTSSINEQNTDSQYQEENGHLGVRTRRARIGKQSLSMQSDEPDDKDYIIVSEEEKDDEATLSEEEELAKKEKCDTTNEINLLQQESEMPIEELLARYKKEASEDCISDSASASLSSDDHTEDCENDKDAQFIESTFKANNTEVQPVEDVDESSDKKESENIIEDAAAAARSAQPTGNTFLTTKVRTKFPFLIKHTLREYQHIGLDWLVTMYEKRLNGILADEMGLGKTIMTISLLAHLACEKGIWGPHLIVVPTSVMLNWETEFLKWCPAFKILTYFGSAKERKNKRQGWMKPNYFHICITTYRLVIQDAKIFKRKKWKYLILDEAHLIKNWKSQRWQTLLNFNSKRRILLTGTPLQNDLMELWSLMHFLMPHVFQSHQEFKDWFSNPISGMVEGQETINKEVVDRLHNVLRPFILRRLKRDVEKQLPKKYEHVIYCRLSKRQRNLYEDFIASSETQATLASANYFGMISVIMQLRKVCNHPDLFEGRPIVSSYDMPNIDMQLSSHISHILSSGPFSHVDLEAFNLIFTHHDFTMTSWQYDEIAAIACPYNLIENKVDKVLYDNRSQKGIRGNIFDEIQKALCEERLRHLKERAASISWWSSLRCNQKPVYGTNLTQLVTVKHPVLNIQEMKNNPSCYLNFSSKLADMVLSPIDRFVKMLDLIEAFMFAIPPSRAPPPNCWCTKSNSPVILHPSYIDKCTATFSPLLTPIRTAIVRKQVYFPDRRLIQFDCGKLQELAVLLRRLKFEGHRVLIFTQMTKMLDILEAFINLYGYTYMRLDGATPPEERQTLMQRFNTNPKYFIFILSTRSGGVGINLVGADTVIFYDSDWNPAMDQQAQDRCHRIGQTREVHIYRLITECTIEENILKKANQKRLLDDLVIQSGSYNTDFLKKLDPLELFSGQESKNDSQLLSNADVEAALKQAEDEADYMALKRVEQEEAVDNQEFTEEVIGKMDDDEIANDDDTKIDDKINVEEAHKNIVSQYEIKALTAAGGDEDIDMLADVKQMAAKAAAAGEASSSFENQLRPIDRYAMHFLDRWDPIVDKSALECSVNVNEQEWELDQIEKYKEDLEAEIDEDQEPFLYEKWDADFATKAYKQHVEALAQQQLLEEQENEALNAENDALRNEEIVERKPKPKKKSKKKPKKAKFKSLKDGSLSSELDNSSEELQMEPYDYVLSPNSEPSYAETTPHSPPSRKRKKPICEVKEEKSSTRSSKKPQKKSDCKLLGDSNYCFEQIAEVNDSKKVGKISITLMPIKRIMVVKPERLKKRTHTWSKDSFPPPDSWSSVEDAVLCASVHEYGTNWNIASDVITSVPLGGLYRGWYRHPVHCCERYRELVLKYVHSTTDGSNAEKSALCGSGKTLLKITEEQARLLLDFATMQPDTDLQLQKHFIAILSAVWKRKYCLDQHKNHLIKLSSQSLEIKSERLTECTDSRTLRQCSKLVHAALDDANEKLLEEPCHVSQPQLVSPVSDHVDLTLDFVGNRDDVEAAFPSTVTVSVHVQIPQFQESESRAEILMAESSCKTAEHRLRAASEACTEGEGQGWAWSAFPSFNNSRNRSSTKSQTLGKHKPFSNSLKTPKSKIQRTTESNDDLNLYGKFIQRSPFIELDGLLDVHIPYENEDDSLFESSLDENGMEKPSLEFIPEDYDPELLSGLEDLRSFQDIADIG